DREMATGREVGVPNNGFMQSSDVIDVRYPRWISNICALLPLSILALIFVQSEVVLTRDQQTGREWLPLIFGFFAFFAVFFCLLRRMTIIRIDALGVAAPRRPWSLTATMVPWDEISSCDFVETQGPGLLGRGVVPVLRGPAGNALFANLSNLKTA